MEEFNVADEPPGDSPFGEAQSPRLSILHLMLWTLCSAVHLTVYRALLSLQGDPPPGYAEIRDASSIITAVVSGALFAGTIVLLRTRIQRGPPMLRQPGHWLLLVPVAQSLVYSPFLAWLLLLSTFGPIPPGNMGISAALMVVTPLGYGFAVWQHRAVHWKLLFLVLAVVGAAQCLLYVVMTLDATSTIFSAANRWVRTLLSLQSWVRVPVVGALAVISIGELLAGPRRDWLHWTGVVTYSAGFLVVLLWTVRAWLGG